MADEEIQTEETSEVEETPETANITYAVYDADGNFVVGFQKKDHGREKAALYADKLAEAIGGRVESSD